jgi:hypothetical protein
MTRPEFNGAVVRAIMAGTPNGPNINNSSQSDVEFGLPTHYYKFQSCSWRPTT